MSAWKGGYDPRGPQKKHEGEWKEPAHRGRTRAVRRVCEDCGRTYYNHHAHLEECSGKVELQLGPTRGLMCQARADKDFGGWAYCDLPAGHRGPHMFR